MCIIRMLFKVMERENNSPTGGVKKREDQMRKIQLEKTEETRRCVSKK